MHVHCKNCKKHTGVLISENKIKGKPKYAICLTKRTFIHEIEGKYDTESELEIYFQFFTDCCKRNMKTYCVKYRKNTENLNSKIFKTKITD